MRKYTHRVQFMLEDIISYLAEPEQASGLPKSGFKEFFDRKGWLIESSWESDWAYLRNRFRDEPRVRHIGQGRKHVRWIHEQYYPDEKQNDAEGYLVEMARRNGGTIAYDMIVKNGSGDHYFVEVKSGLRSLTLDGLMTQPGIGSPSFRVRCPEQQIQWINDFLDMEGDDRISILERGIKALEDQPEVLEEWIRKAKTKSELVNSMISILTVLPKSIDPNNL